MFGGVLNRFRSQPPPVLPDELQAPNLELLEETAERGDCIERMVATTGWKLVIEDVEDRFRRLQKDLRYANLQEVPQLQAKLQELEWLLEYPAKTVEAGKTAQEQLRQIRAEAQAEKA